MKRRALLLLLSASMAVPMLAFQGGCGGPAYVVDGEGPTYLMTNLHADARRRLTSLNYSSPRGGTLLPICTPVTLERIRGRVITFRADTTGLRYQYIVTRHSRAPVEEHVQRYFGTQCPNIGSMSPEDQAGVQNGQVYQGMTKQGVIMAIGYPPEHATPTLQGDVWKYWATSNNRFEVYFTNGIVSGIRN
ncbi:MAG: hypothetical protein JJ863_03975 [Deltaproteobacteria bacterium]|nr:hypothetical protein [Deltaproteobacteria bacterium]